MKKISIVDYGSGNLLSVQRAFEYLGAEVKILSQPEEIIQADRIILPGVGAFGDSVETLEGLGLVESIIEFCKTGKYFMGICLGMQLLFESSEEFGFHKGLSIMKGKVKAIPKQSEKTPKIKVPHVGWNRLKKAPNFNSTWDNEILSGVKEGDFVYFTHSYSVLTEERNISAVTNYYDLTLTAMVSYENVYGCQFHIERSSNVGLKNLAENFLNLD